MSSSHETACHVIMYLNVELELALVAIQKCLVLLHNYLGPNTKKPWLHTHTQIDWGKLIFIKHILRLKSVCKNDIFSKDFSVVKLFKSRCENIFTTEKNEGIGGHE